MEEEVADLVDVVVVVGGGGVVVVDVVVVGCVVVVVVDVVVVVGGVLKATVSFTFEGYIYSIKLVKLDVLPKCKGKLVT